MNTPRPINRTKVSVRFGSNAAYAKPVLFMMGLLLGFYSLLNIFQGVDGGDGWPLQVVVLTALYIGVYVFCTYKYFKTLYLFSNAYLLAFTIFHLGLVIQIVFGIIPGGAWIAGSFSVWVELACWYILLAMAMFVMGFSIGLMARVTRAASPEIRLAYKKKTLKFARYSSFGLLLAAVIFFFFAIRSYGNLLEYMRADLYGDGNDSRGLGVFMMIFPGAATLMLVSSQTKVQTRRALFLAGFSFLLFMFSGYRSGALFPCLIGVILWVKTGRSFPKWLAVTMLSVVVISISVFGAFRQMGAFGDLGMDELKSSYEQSSVTASFSELGQTAGIVAHTLRLVPDVNNHFSGASYWRALRGMFPNVGFNVNAKNSRSDLTDDIKMDDRALSKLNPSSWLTYHIKPAQFAKGGGVGFSTVAEPYLNFGVGGVVIFFLLLGYFMARLDSLDLFVHPFLFVFCGSILWFLVRTVRNDFANFLKPLGFMIIILIIWHISLRFIGRRTI